MTLNRLHSITNHSAALWLPFSWFPPFFYTLGLIFLGFPLLRKLNLTKITEYICSWQMLNEKLFPLLQFVKLIFPRSTHYSICNSGFCIPHQCHLKSDCMGIILFPFTTIFLHFWPKSNHSGWGRGYEWNGTLLLRLGVEENNGCEHGSDWETVLQ